MRLKKIIEEIEFRIVQLEYRLPETSGKRKETYIKETEALKRMLKVVKSQ